MWHHLEWQKRAICEGFLCENCIFHQFANVFSLESFWLYGRDNVAVVIVVNTNQTVKMGKAWGWAKGRAGAIIAKLPVILS